MKVSSDSPPALSWRIGLTLALLALPLVGERIPLPGIDAEAAAELGGRPRLLSAFALGITPLLSAALMVECVALLVPRWNRLRHDWPRGRARLNRAVEITALVLAGFQAFGVVMMLSASPVEGLLNGEAWTLEVIYIEPA